MMRPVLGGPGISDEAQFSRKHVFRDGKFDPHPGGGFLAATKSRDLFSSGPIEVLEPGLLMGLITASKLWAPSFFGVAQSALTHTGTTLTVTAAQAAELVRRVGASGSLSIVGPTAANGTARQSTLTYSAVNTTTGAITVTSIGVNQTERIRLAPAATGGNLTLNIQKPDGTFATTANIAWSATDATFLANINSALDTASGVTGGIVATAISATDTDLGFELAYSGGSYAGRSWRRAEVVGLPTSVTDARYEPLTAAVAGAFAAGSLIGDTDGSQVPASMIPPGYGIMVADGANQPTIEQWAAIPISGIIDMAQLAPVVTDTGIKNWIKDSLSTTRGGKFIFPDVFGR